MLFYRIGDSAWVQLLSIHTFNIFERHFLFQIKFVEFDLNT